MRSGWLEKRLSGGVRCRLVNDSLEIFSCIPWMFGGERAHARGPAVLGRSSFHFTECLYNHWLLLFIFWVSVRFGSLGLMFR